MWAFCGDDPYAQWGIGPEGPDRARGNCHHAYQHDRYKGYCDGTQPHPGSQYRGSWTVSLELGGSIAILEVMFGIFSPPCPVSGDATLSGGIIFDSAAACPHIPFKLEGWAKIGFSGSITVVGLTIPVLEISLKVGVKITGNAARTTRSNAARRRSCCGDWFGRRRRDHWVTHYKAAHCDVEVYAKAEMTLCAFVGCLKGWISMQYWIISKTMKIVIGADAQLGSGWFGTGYNEVYSQTLYNEQLR